MLPSNNVGWLLFLLKIEVVPRVFFVIYNFLIIYEIMIGTSCLVPTIIMRVMI